MVFVISSLAGQVGGEVVGDGSREVSALRPLEEADEGCLSPLFRKRLLGEASRVPPAVLAPPDLAEFALENGVKAALVHRNPPLALARLIDLFHPEEPRGGFVHPSAVVSASARIHETAWIGPGVVVEEGVTIGEGSWVGPNAVICSGSLLGRWVRVGPGAVIGYDGFGYAPSEDGPVRVRQVGTVELGDFVEIGSGACVDRATLGRTVIGPETKIDNLVQIGHNARVGRRVLIAAQTGLAGSTRIGDGAMLGGQVGVGDHVRVGPGTRVAGQSGVTGDTGPRETLAGTPAVPRGRWLRAMAGLYAEGAGRRGEEPEDS